MSKKIITKIGKLNNSEIADVSEIHYNSMRGVFSKLGIEFIQKYYQSVNKNGLFYCKKINGKINNRNLSEIEPQEIPQVLKVFDF